jgi:hypothetical protein
MAKAFSWDTNYNRILASGGTADDPMTFEDIWRYFQDNPLSSTFEYPRDTNICSQNELCEQNASDWVNANGLDTPADDAVDFTHNSYSIKATVSAVPAPDVSATSIYRSSAYIIVSIADTSAYSVNEHIKISGTTNFNGIYLIQYISTNNYIRLRCPKSVDDLSPADDSAPATENSLSILKPLSLIWNDDRAIARTIPIDHCQTMKFSLRTDSAEANPVCCGIALRNMYNDNSESAENRNYYGANLLKDFEMSSIWADYEVTIKDEFDLSQWIAGYNGSYRGYWFRLGKVGFFFEGLAVGDTVWLDGVRFNSDRNPVKEYDKGTVYRFKTGLRVTGHFKDRGFNVIHDCLSSVSGRHTALGSANSFEFYASNYGDIEVGDYSGDFIEKDGGVIVIDNFSHEDTGNIKFRYCYVQGLTIRGNKGIAACGGIYCGESFFKSCNFQNILNLLNSFTLEDSMFSGGRYFMLGGSNSTLNNVIVTGTRGQIWFLTSRSATEYIDVRNLKVINQDNIIYTYNYNAEGKPYGARFIDLDVSECDNPYFDQNNSGGEYPTYNKVAYSVNFKITDENGDALEDATVTMKDTDDTTVFSETTDGDGEITEQIVDSLVAYSDGTSRVRFYFNTPDVNWIKKYPFSLEISKTGYETYRAEGLSLDSPKSETITLKSVKKIRKTVEGKILYALKAEEGSRANLINL